MTGPFFSDRSELITDTDQGGGTVSVSVILYYPTDAIIKNRPAIPECECCIVIYIFKLVLR